MKIYKMIFLHMNWNNNNNKIITVITLIKFLHNIQTELIKFTALLICVITLNIL